MSPLRSPRRVALGVVAAGSALGVALFAGPTGAPKPAAPQLASQAQLVTVSNPRTSVKATDIAKVARTTKHQAPSKAAVKRLTRPTPKPQEIRKRQLAVEFDKDTSAADRAALRKQYGVTSHERVTGSVERWELPDAGTERTTAKQLSDEPGVAVATPNHVYTLSSADTRFGEQWGLNQANDHDIDAPEAWAATDASVTSTVTVAVVDTGVDIDHPDLANQLWRNPGEYGPDGRGGRKETNGVDDDYDGAKDNLRGINAIDPTQSVKPGTANGSYHGTHVAGIIAAERGNNQGVAGVSKQARIMAVKAFDGQTGDDTSILSGIDFAIRKGAKIINGSFGGWTDDAGSSSNLLTSMIAQNPDVLFVFAAGNDGVQTAPGMLRSYPCSAPADNVLCVGATDENDVRATYSNWGSDVDLSAPGSNILSTMPGNSYALLSGTSMATPMAVGAAALLKAQTPSLTPVQLKARLANTADATGDIDDGLAGRFNLDNAVANRMPALPPATATAAARVQSNILFYDAAAGVANKVQVTASGTQSYDIVDRAARITPGTGCTALSPISVRCTGVASYAIIKLGDLQDQIYAPTSLSQNINVGAGGSYISVGSGNTGITGGDGRDSIQTGDGSNTITTGADDDFIHTGAGNDYVDTGDGDDTVSSEAGDDEIHGGAGDDWFLDGGGSDRVFGDGGADRFWVAAGGTDEGYGADWDHIDGGSGDDDFSPATSAASWGSDGAGVTFSGGAGIDRLSYGDWGSVWPLTAQIGSKTGNGFGGKDAIGADIEVLQGSEGDDVLIGSDAADVLVGGRGNDKVDGRGGDDLLDEDGDVYGSTGAFGNDQLIGGAGTDIVDYSRPSLGGANVNGAITASLDNTRNDGATARGENDLIAGDVEGITGGPLADTLRAGSYSAVLEGGLGADTLVGGSAADSIYTQDAVVDTITCGGGSDFVRKDATDSANADCETTTGAPLVRITGSLPVGGSTSNRQPAMEFTVAGGPDVTSVCRVLNAAGQVGTAGACTTAWMPSAPLPDGNYGFAVISTSPTAGSSAAQRTFTVDTVAPDTTLVSGPDEWHEADAATFTLGSTETKVTYECKLDDEKWRRCGSVETYTDLTNGSHEFQARATDAADNRDPTVLSYDFISYVQAPQTKLTKAPTTPTALTSATFEFTATPASSTFECKLDAGTWVACTSPKTVSGLSNAAHTFSVRGVSSGNADPTPASYTWTVDPAVKPEINLQILSTYGVYGLGFGLVAAEFTTTTPQFAFTSNQPNVTFECAVNADTNADPVYVPCTSPWTSPAQSGTVMVGYLFRVKNAAGATGGNSFPATFDLEAPTTTLTGGIAEGENTAEPKQQFRFTGTDNKVVGRFQCKIDTGAWATCDSPYVTPALAVGAHAIEIRTRDRAGNVDATPERRAFNVVAPTTPNTEWVGVAPTASRLSDLAPTLRFKATPSGGRFECAAGTASGATFAPCTSPWTVPQQQDGTTVLFQVRAIGPTGLVDASPAQVAYVFDGTAPDTTITAGPAAGSTIPTTSTSLSFSASETATFECKLDAAAWAACTSPKALTALDSGSHTFSVRAKDTAGNIDATPATRTFTVPQSQILTVGDPVASPTTATLTSDATLGSAVDWVHWKGVAATDLDRKSGTAIIPSWVNYAGNTHAKYALTGSTTFSWTNASGTASGSSALGVSGGGANGRGFTLAVPAANAETRKLKLWLGVRGTTTTGALNVKFNGSTAIAKQFAGNSNTTPVNRTVTIDYRPLAATDTLTVSWYQGGGAVAATSQVVLYAAAVY